MAQAVLMRSHQYHQRQQYRMADRSGTISVLVDNLRATGANIQPAGDITQPFFSVKGLVITVNGSNVQVFEYADANAADAEAALVSSDGSSIGTTMASWVAPPHFYEAEKLIVLYVGESEAIIDILESVLGPQFAGR